MAEDQPKYQQRKSQNKSPPSFKRQRSSSVRLRQRLQEQRKRYEKQRLLFNALTYPKNSFALYYHYFVSILMILDLTFLSMTTVNEYYNWSSLALKITDAIVIIVLLIEFMLRLWSSQHNYRYRGVGGIVRYLVTPYSLLDLLVLIVTASLLIKQLLNPAKHYSFNWLRFVQVTKLIRLDIPFRRWHLVMSVVHLQQQQLLTIFYVCSICLMLITFIIYFVEHNEPHTEFTSIPKTIWWSVISLLTIGYGDMYPQTTTGRLLSSIIFIFSVSLFAVPSGIIATGIALKVAEQKRYQKKHLRRRLPAILLIQWTWFYYAVIRYQAANSFSCVDNAAFNMDDDDNLRSTKFPFTIAALCRYFNVNNCDFSVRYRRRSSSKTTKTKSSMMTSYSSMTDETDDHSRINLTKLSPKYLNESNAADSESETTITMNCKQSTLMKMLCLFQYQLIRIRFQLSNPYGDLNDLIDKQEIMNENLQKRLSIIMNYLSNIDKKLDRLQLLQPQQLQPFQMKQQNHY